ncbi:MAG: hypothetical protein JWR54_3719, partial [Mucilaginibacter sp.]|nr:hypothetical protein [Mucilaginibacter sp.]
MKKLIILISVLSAFQAQAQTTITKAISTGFELAIPSNGVYNIGIGASAKGELPISA